MGTIASQITSFTIVYSIVYSNADQRKHQRSASLAFVRGIHRGPVNSPHKRPVTRKMFPFDDVFMILRYRILHHTITIMTSMPHERHGVSCHRRLEYMFNRLFGLTSKKRQICVLLALCVGNPPVTGGFPYTKGQQCWEHYRAMTSSWMSWITACRLLIRRLTSI